MAEREARTGAPLALSVKGALGEVPVGRTRFYEAISSGELVTFRIGRRRFVRRSALEAWVAALEARERAGE